MLEEKRKIIRIGYTQIRVNEVDEKKKVRGTTWMWEETEIGAGNYW